LQALGWIPAFWLVAVELLIARHKLPRDGAALRIAGCAGAASVLVTGAALSWWPLAVLGLLWLRAEVLALTHSTRQEQGLDSPPAPAFQGLAEQAAETADPPGPGRESVLRRPWSGLRAGLARFGPPALAILFKIEMLAVIVTAVVLFGIWSAHQRATFNQKADTSVCGLLGRRC
jgi:hypothetical protein